MGAAAKAATSQSLMALTSTVRFSRLTISCPSSSKTRSSTLRPSRTQCVVHLLRFARRDVGVVEAVNQQQRCGHRVRAQQRRQTVEQFPVADGMAVLRVSRRGDPRFGGAVPRVQIAHPADADSGGEKLRMKGERGLRQISAVRPTAARDAVLRREAVPDQIACRVGDVVDRRESPLPVVGVHEGAAESPGTRGHWEGTRRCRLPAAAGRTRCSRGDLVLRARRAGRSWRRSVRRQEAGGTTSR